MVLSEYQAAAHRTAAYPGQGQPLGLHYAALGLAGEAGEVAGKVSKTIRDDLGLVTHERHAALVDELGDVLWYVAQVASELNVDLGEVAVGNVAKLRRRAATGTIQGDGDGREWTPLTGGKPSTTEPF